MSISQATKLRWFDRGAAAFERTFPGVITRSLGVDAGPRYVCPICDDWFPRASVADGVLTAEHVPPESFGGRELVLTCRRCNNEAGSTLDADARKKETVAEVGRGMGIPRPLKVRFEHAGRKLNASLTASTSGGTLTVGKAYNNPASVSALLADGQIRKGAVVTVEFAGDRFAELGARMSWFRSGFLALFAVFGYRYTFDPALEIVKTQLRAPQTRLIYAFTSEIRSRLPWWDWRILEACDPHCYCVMFGRYVTFYPYPGDLTFYQRTEAQIVGRRGALPEDVTVEVLSQRVRAPLFGYEPEGSLSEGGRDHS